jgi:hypothetical protein
MFTGFVKLEQMNPKTNLFVMANRFVITVENTPNNDKQIAVGEQLPNR